MPRRLRAPILVALHVIAIAMLGPALTVAASSALAAPERHCVAQARSSTQLGPTAPARCFATFARAISFATGGGLQLHPGTSSRQLSASELLPSGITSTTVIGVDYVDANFSGNTLTWWVDNPNGCSDGTFYWADSMPSGWNDVVSSAASYQGCINFWHWEHINRAGTGLNCTFSCASMGVMNDQTSSEEWSCGC